MIQLSFNPYRVFKFAATLVVGEGLGFGRFGFNPYRVFKFAATWGQPSKNMHPGTFQSLSGFQVRCNAAIRK